MTALQGTARYRRGIVAGALMVALAGLLAYSKTEYNVEIAVATRSESTLQVEVLSVPIRALDSTLRELRAAGAAAGVNKPIRALADPRVDEQWGYRRLGGELLHSAGATGSGVVVAVLDTGVDARHPELAGKVIPGFNVLTGSPVETSVDPGGHGTHVAGVIAAAAGNGEGGAGMAPEVRIMPVTVLDETGYGDDAGVAAGLVWAVDNGAQIANMSLGTYDNNPALQAAVEYAVSKGVLVVASSGNDMAGGPTSYPAAYPQALAVAATTSGEQRAFFSTTGDYVDVAAPGQMILSTFPDGRYVTMSGTSMAAPFVSAAAAVVMQKRGVSALRAGQLLTETATDLGVPGKDPETGAGLISATEASGVAGPQPPVEDGFLSMPGMPALPPLPSLPLPSLPPGASLPPLPPLPALGRMPASPALPVLPEKPGAAPIPSPRPGSTLPDTPAPQAPPSLPATPLEPPVLHPGTGFPPQGPSARPSVTRPAVALAVSRKAGTWVARVQASGPGSARSSVKLVAENGKVLARGRTDAQGRTTIVLGGKPGSVVAALVGQGRSNPVKLTP